EAALRLVVGVRYVVTGDRALTGNLANLGHCLAPENRCSGCSAGVWQLPEPRNKAAIYTRGGRGRQGPFPPPAPNDWRSEHLPPRHRDPFLVTDHQMVQ